MNNPKPSSAVPTKRSLVVALRHVPYEATPILKEQFEYLLHHNRGCKSDCSDCARLRRIEAILIEPFCITNTRSTGRPDSGHAAP
jgi:hypothetical protein